eukprot:sb/3461123/
MCGLRSVQLDAVPQELACGTSPCNIAESPGETFNFEVMLFSEACQKEGCRESIPVSICKEQSTTCNGVCDVQDCRDEFSCNGYNYGIMCDIQYISPDKVCVNGLGRFCKNMPSALSVFGLACDLSTYPDLPSCESPDKLGMYQLYEGNVKPIFDFLRCSTIKFYSQYIDCTVGINPGDLDPYRKGSYAYIPVCKNFMDQTNCSDTARVALSCPIGGYNSTVSKVMVCDELRVGLCDDNLDILCVDVTATCTLHKHQICDGKVDCLSETDEICRYMTGISICKRKVNKSEYSKIPISWLSDGYTDCVGGEDEHPEMWPTCGNGTTRRFVESNLVSCEDVVVCKGVGGKLEFIPTELLCDGIDTCGNENNMCVRHRIEVFNTALSVNQGWRKFLLHCMPGLSSIEVLSGSKCTSTPLNNTEIFGTKETELNLPSNPVSCRYVYGEIYVYLACSNRCSDNVTCPFDRTPLKRDACPADFPKKVLTYYEGDQLTIVTRKGEWWVQETFQCANQRCLTFYKVCNLVDDCGDGSDEIKCVNHFKCGQKLLPLYQVCDGVTDCFDRSDECNEQCSTHILEGFGLKIFAFVFGSFATGLNVWTLLCVARQLPGVKRDIAFQNRILVGLVSFGDTLNGVYLLIVAVYDQLQSDEYCEKQDDWLTSHKCNLLGIFSTSASCLSVFAMTSLSLTRAVGVTGGVKPPKDRKVVKTTSFAITLMVLAVSIAASPVILATWLEDVFISGQVWDEQGLQKEQGGLFSDNELEVCYKSHQRNLIRSVPAQDKYGRALLTTDYMWMCKAADESVDWFRTSYTETLDTFEDPAWMPAMTVRSNQRADAAAFQDIPTTRPTTTKSLISKEINECPIGVVEGFLKRKCREKFEVEYATKNRVFDLYQCVNSLQRYFVEVSVLKSTLLYGFRCTENINYEMCGLRSVQLDAVPQELACGTSPCNIAESPGETFNFEVMLFSEACQKDECRESIPVSICKEQFTTCNGVCDVQDCRDEFSCNGYNYGIMCDTQYISPDKVCVNGLGRYCKSMPSALSAFGLACDLSTYRDLPSCESPEKLGMYQSYEGDVKPIFDFLRCSTIKFYSQYIDCTVGINPGDLDPYRKGSYAYIPVCKNFMDQTNCSDPARVALSCPIGGYNSTVSKVMVCDELRVGLCDDNLDTLCVDVTATCTLHKHQICDGKVDCLSETDEICRYMTGISICKRKVNKGEYSKIPISWLSDGYTDCVGGEDEHPEMWPTCGNGTTRRFVESNLVSCEDVVVCKGVGGKLEFIPTEEDTLP